MLQNYQKKANNHLKILKKIKNSKGQNLAKKFKTENSLYKC